MKYFVMLIIAGFLMACSGREKPLSGKIETGIEGENQDTLYANLSVELLQTVRNSGDVDPLVEKLAAVSADTLAASLDTREERKAFWLNIYNAYVQILLGEDPELLKTRLDFFGYNFFSSRQITIAGHELSLDDIEHGIIRHSKIKLALGYLDKWSWFVDDFEDRFRLDEADYRVHFALNCGAASCPKIALLESERVDEQLDLIAKQFLENSTDYNAEEGVVEVIKYFSWFRGDFGGVDEVPGILKKYEVIPQSAAPSVEFKEYDWNIDLGNFTDV